MLEEKDTFSMRVLKDFTFLTGQYCYTHVPVMAGLKKKLLCTLNAFMCGQCYYVSTVYCECVWSSFQSPLSFVGDSL